LALNIPAQYQDIEVFDGHYDYYGFLESEENVGKLFAITGTVRYVGPMLDENGLRSGKWGVILLTAKWIEVYQEYKYCPIWTVFEGRPEVADGDNIIVYGVFVELTQMNDGSWVPAFLCDGWKLNIKEAEIVSE